MIFEINIPKINLETECTLIDDDNNMFLRQTIIGGAMFIITSKYKQILNMLMNLIELHSQKIQFLELININTIANQLKNNNITTEFLITKEIMSEIKLQPKSVVSIGDLTGTCLDAFSKAKTKISITNSKSQTRQDNKDTKYIHDINVKKDKPSEKAIDVVICWSESQINEIDSSHHILAEITYALGMLAANGHIVIRMFGITMPISLKLVYILGQFFEKLHIMKPQVVDQKTHDIFIIGSGYRYNQNMMTNLLELHQLLKENKQPLQDITIKPSYNKNDFELYKISRYLQNERYKNISVYHDFLHRKNFHDKIFFDIQKIQKENTINWIKRNLTN